MYAVVLVGRIDGKGQFVGGDVEIALDGQIVAGAKGKGNGVFAESQVMTLESEEYSFSFAFGYGETFRPYIYVAPRFDLWLNGKLRWERTYDNESYEPVTYESELNKATMQPYDISAVAGIGICSRIMVRQTRLFLKFDLSYGMSVLSNFSKLEVDESIPFQGWGDIEHETLGQRRLQNVEARLTLLLPLRKSLKDACAFDQQMKKSK